MNTLRKSNQEMEMPGPAPLEVSAVGSISSSLPVMPSQNMAPQLSPYRKFRRVIGNAARKVGLKPPLPPPPPPEPVVEVPAIPERPPHYPISFIPQSDTMVRVPFHVEDRDWRAEYTAHLSGRGLEIGPLHRPMVKHEGMHVEYLDRHSVAELKVKYSELGDLPLVEPDIIDDAETMQTVPSAVYDFVVAAHVIEHMRNPLGALENWARVLKPGGLLYLVVPDKRATFDYRRVRTLHEHLVLDYRCPSLERDFDHYLEYVVQVDGQRGEFAFCQAEKLAQASYPIHYHVFLPDDIVRLLGWFSNNVRRVEMVLGPSAAHWSDEFHLLVRVP